jgi:DNA helicase IV
VLHPKADIPRQVFDTETDFQRYVTERQTNGKATIGSLAGVYVKSFQEQSIANWLWLNSVTFEYEKQIAVDDGHVEGSIRHVHPDFYYPATGTVHEHFALNADGTSPFPDYVEHAESKRIAYRNGQIDFFETTSAQASEGTMLTVLQAELERRQVPFARRGLDEVQKTLQPMVIKHYHLLIGTCIKHIRANHLTLDMLTERAKSLRSDGSRTRCAARWPGR